VGAAYKIHASAVVLLAVLLAGCSGAPRREAPPPSTPAPAQAPTPEQPRAQHEGRAFKIDSAESLLTVLVYRGGPLARAGHNHVVASHDLTGMAYVPQDPTGTSFDIHMPVDTLVVDEEALRAQEGPDFPPGVPEDAKEGTRRNMLGEALLNGDRYPEIELQSENIQRIGDSLQAQIRVIVRDQAYSLLVPVQYRVEGDVLHVEGELPLKQTDVGLTPFSLFGGALRVLDDIKVKFRIVARAAAAH
jgi:hypothetical protein